MIFQLLEYFLQEHFFFQNVMLNLMHYLPFLCKNVQNMSEWNNFYTSFQCNVHSSKNEAEMVY